MILVDTSAWIDFFSAGKLSRRVDQLLEANQAAICGPILTEIYRGFRSAKDRERVMPLFAGCRTLSQPIHLWEEAGQLGFALGKIGRRVKTLDLLIASYALAHQVPLLTGDADFTKMKEAGIPLVLD